MALQAIFQSNSVDHHADCFDGRSRINVQVTELIRQLQLDGFTLIESKEQGYYRQANRANHGVYSVFLNCAAFPELALMIVDSKDCQKSLGLFIALQVNSDYYPIKSIGKIRHNKRHTEKFEALKLYITDLALSELSKASEALKQLDAAELTESQLIEIQILLTALRQVNYPSSESIQLIDYRASYSLKDACFQSAVKWLPHQLKYCSEAYRLISEAIKK